MHVEFVEDTDEYWTPSDIKDVIKNFSEADRFRLKNIAKQHANHCLMDVDEILNEAIFRILSEKRHCHRNIPVITFIAQTMRSIAFNERRKNEKLEPIDNSVPIPDKALSLENRLSSHQEIEYILKLFENDDDVELLLMGIYDGLDPNEICELAQWDRKKYNTVRKKLRRGLNKHFPNGRSK